MTRQDRSPGRTNHHREFDADVLARRKRRDGRTVSVVIPARDEEGTVGDVVRTVVGRLVARVGLVDEVLVVDADSRDATAREARAAGARVVRQSEILPGSGTGSGKGEALWKGLAASSGDLVAFVDADLQQFDERFLVGLLGPLLHDPSVRFVKAAYERPLRVGDELWGSGGGRVTELLARPLITTFWPELRWLAQPLSGEYAGDRALLESLPFVQGYGVELAMLVDILERHGAGVIAQVDLDRRLHRNQPLDALGRMSTEILQVALDRLVRSGRMLLTDALEDELLQPTRNDDGELTLQSHRIRPSERPPLSEWLEHR